jgi:hypothetical protein
MTLQNLKESDIQIQVADWLRLFEARCGFIFFAVPNEGMGEAKTTAGLGRMAKLKRMGLRPGVADIVIVKLGRVYFLELKAIVGRQSDKQILFECDAMRVGAEYAVVHSLDEAQKKTREWRIVP